MNMYVVVGCCRRNFQRDSQRRNERRAHRNVFPNVRPLHGTRTKVRKTGH